MASILLGDNPDELVRDLQDRFPKARLIGADGTTKPSWRALSASSKPRRLGLDLPLDVRGTAFQRRVWQALQEIPIGQTVSYTEIAQRIGSPRAIRAVARACATNHLAVAIPCHRVVRNEDRSRAMRGGLSGSRP